MLNSGVIWNSQIDGLEAGAAAEDVEAEAEILLDEGLLAAAEEAEFAGIGRAGDARARGYGALPRWFR